MYDYVNRPRRNIIEVLYDFRHTTPNIPFEYLFDLIPPIRPRAFSIASSPSVHKDRIQLLVAVVSFKTKLLVKERLGLCSNYLKRLAPGAAVVPIWVRRGTFAFPPPSTPLVMVGPGTGIAPFRSFVTEALHRGDNEESDKLMLAVFFGCRRKQSDFYFATEWPKLEETSGGRFRFFSAFSRDQEDKEYVQHVIERHAEIIEEVIFERQGSVFIAGNAKMMPDQVMDAVKKASGLSAEDAEKYTDRMLATKRLQMETWS